MIIQQGQFVEVRGRALRDERKLSQDELARLFGFKDRQTVSAIETGERRVSAEELLTAIEKLGAPLDYFTNPFLLVGEGRFSWRQSGVGPAPPGSVRAQRRTLDRGLSHARAAGRTSDPTAAADIGHYAAAQLRGGRGRRRTLRDGVPVERRSGGAPGGSDGA
jgi:DNA-binding XRE family transcriptional regulator